MVFGQPITCTPVLCAAKYSASTRRVGVGIVATDDNDCGDAVLLANLLPRSANCSSSLQFGSAGTDDIETAGVSVLH